LASTESNDDLILRLLRERQHDKAFRALLEAYRDKLYHLCTACMREPARAQDALQESLIKIWRFLPKYDGRASLYTWIYTIARNQCRTENAKQPKFVSLPEHCEEGLSVENSVDETDPQAVVMKRSEIEKLRAMVDRLPERSRRVLLLFYYEDHSVREVAKMLAMPEATVRTHLHRARATLWDQLRRRGLRPDAPRVEASR
jgi:RNA polymerase sigma-70 factor, ECF subfamily